MRLIIVSLSLFLIFCVALFFSSCGLTTPQNPNNQAQTNNSSNAFDVTATTTQCSANSSCKTDCQNLFIGQSALKTKCLKQVVKDVRTIKKTVNSMKEGNYSSIQADDIQTLVEFDLDLWLKYADTNRKNSLNMLEWIAKTPEVADILDDNIQILKSAFLQVGSSQAQVSQSERRNYRMRDGIKTPLVTADNQDSTNQTFFEIASLTSNDSAFKLAHKILVESCSEDHFCVKNFYCNLDEDIVLNRLNHLKLVDDAKPNGGRLYPSNCN